MGYMGLYVRYMGPYGLYGAVWGYMGYTGLYGLYGAVWGYMAPYDSLMDPYVPSMDPLTAPP